MAFENGGMSPADMAALMRGGNNNGGWGNDGASGWWVILFFLLCLNGGWNNGGWGNNGGGGAVPYIQADVQRGFDQQATTGQISALQAQVGNGFADAAVARCAGDANITAAVTNAQFGVTQAIGGAKDTLALGLNQLAMANQQGFYDNKAATADLKYTVATEACADRNAVNNGIRDVITAGTANTQQLLNGLNEVIRTNQQGTQTIIDKLCALELDNVKRENADLRTRLQMADLAASQTAQTAQILQGQTAQAQYITNTCCPKPIPAYNVPNPGCGCGGFNG